MLFVCCVAFDKTEKGPILYIKKREREREKEEEKKGGKRKESEQMVTLAVNKKLLYLIKDYDRLYHM